MLHPSDVDTAQLESLRPALATARCNCGQTLFEASEVAPVLVVFLRHTGCPFCVEALDDIARQRRAVEGTGVKIVLVHMGSESELAPFFDSHGVGDLPRVADPDQSLYLSFGLKRGSVSQLLGFSALRRLWPSMRRGGRASRPVGDPWQMPGVFLIHRGEVIAAYRHRSQADRPDYCSIAGAAPSRNQAASEVR